MVVKLLLLGRTTSSMGTLPSIMNQESISRGDIRRASAWRVSCDIKMELNMRENSKMKSSTGQGK